MNLRATLSTIVPANGRIVITLPTVMSVYTGTTLTCTFAEPTTVAVATCNYVGRVITATLGATPLPASFFQLNIASAVNPPSATTTDTFAFRTENSGGTMLDQQIANIFLTATPGTLASSTLSPTSQVVGLKTTLTVSFTTSNRVMAGGKVRVTFPKWNSGATVSSEILPMIDSGFVVTAGTNLIQGGLTATFANDVLTISGAIPSDIPANSVISFTVTEFRNPITTSTFSGFVIRTTDASDGVIDSGSATIRVTTPASVYESSISSKDTTRVQEKAVLRLQFKVPVPLNSGCIIDVTFPSDYSLSGADLTTVQGFGLFGGARVLTGSLNVGNNTYTITDGCTNYVSQDLIGILDFNSIKNPFSVKPTDSVRIFVKDSTQFSIAQVTTGITYTATPGTMTGVTLTPENTIVSTVTAIRFRFLPAHSLLATTTVFEIVLPSDVSIVQQTNPSTCTLSELQYISPSVTCTVVGNTITLTNPFQINYTPTSSEVLGFKINGMTMPPSLKPPGAVIITSKVGSPTLYNVDTISATGLFVATVGSMSEFSVTPTNRKTYVTTTYTFAFKPQNAILQNGYVTVDIPTQVSIPNPTTAASSCVRIDGFQTAITCTILDRKITVTNGFQTGNFAAGGQVSFSMNGILNPVSTSTTSSFVFQTFDSNNYQINVRSSGITVTMTSVGDLERASLTLGSTINGATTTYTFTFRASSPLVDGDKMYIKVPDSITPPVSPTCTGITKLAATLTCNTLNKEIYVTLSFTGGTKIDPSIEFAFSIAGFKNPSSTKPTNALTFQAQDSTGALINTYTSALVVRVTTDTAATITTASVNNENKLASQRTTIKMTLTTIHEVPLNGVIIIKYPSEIQPFDNSVATVTCSLNIASSPTCTHVVANRQIVISNIIATTPLAAGTSVEITLNEMKNPATATPTSTFTVGTYETTDYVIDQVSTGLTIKVDCNYPCRSCNAATPSECLSCLNDASGNQLKLQTTTTGGVTSTT